MKVDLKSLRLVRVLAAALAVAATAASCAFIGSDMFPTQLQEKAASYDLASAAGLSPDKVSILRIKRLVSSNGAAGVLALTNTATGTELFVFDDGLHLKATLTNSSFGKFMGTDDTGNFVCGTARIAPNSWTAVSAYTACNDGSLDIGRSADIINGSESSSTLITGENKSGSVWGASTPIRSGYFYDLMDSWLASSSSSLIILVRNRSNGTGLTALDLGLASNLAANIFTGSAIFDNPNATITQVSGDYVDRAWLTADGILALTHSNNTQLVRYAYKSGKKLDSLLIDETWMSGISFDETGSYWYYYDRYKGRLYEMRTWWK
jgi:hypothetical protein